MAANITGEMRMLVTPTALTGCHNQELHNLRVLWSFFSRISDNKPITLRHRVSYYTRNYFIFFNLINPLTPNDPYSGRTEPLISKRCILYIYSTNIGTEYFKHGIYCSFFSLQNTICFNNSNVFGSCIIHILYTGCANITKIITAPKG